MLPLPEAIVCEHAPMNPGEPSAFCNRGVPEDISPPVDVEQQQSTAHLHITPHVHHSGRERKPDVH